MPEDAIFSVGSATHKALTPTYTTKHSMINIKIYSPTRPVVNIYSPGFLTISGFWRKKLMSRDCHPSSDVGLFEMKQLLKLSTLLKSQRRLTQRNSIPSGQIKMK